MLNIHLIIFLKSSSVSIFFHLLNSTQASSASPLFARCLSLTQLNNTEIYPIPKRGREENRAPRKCNISVFNIEVYKIRAEMGSMAICLFRYFLRRRRRKKVCLSAYVFLGAWATVSPAHLIWKIMFCMAMLLYIIAICDQGSFTMCHTSG